MGKIAIVYWSGTGNTEAMASLVAEGAGGSADLFTADQFSPDQAAGYSALAFGCPSMGAEQLEEAEFEPMFESVKPQPGRQDHRPVRLLRLGRRRVDAHLGGRLRGRRLQPGGRAGDRLRRAGGGRRRRLPGAGEGPGRGITGRTNGTRCTCAARPAGCRETSVRRSLAEFLRPQPQEYN